MLIKDFLPAPSVRAYVQCYRIVHFEFSAWEPLPFKAYPPKPEQCLHFFTRDAFAVETATSARCFQPAVVLGGQQTALVKQFNGRNFIDVQVVFQPTALYRLLGIPCHLFTNQFIDAAAVFPAATVSATLEQLQQTSSYPVLLAIIENFVQGLVKKTKKDPHPLDTISLRMKAGTAAVSMDVLARESCLCTKQFTRNFFERTGVNPKTYARIIRFNKAFNLKNWFCSSDWSVIADRSGYTDYQHLSKDYKEFTGFTPHEFHQLEAKSPERILQLSKNLYRTRAFL